MKILNNNQNMKLQAYIYKSTLCGSFLPTNDVGQGETFPREKFPSSHHPLSHIGGGREAPL